MNYYQFHIGDFRSGTVNMSRKARWIYRDMIDVYYDTELPLPSDMDVLCDMLGIENEEERQIVERHLRFKFELTQNGYVHDVCEKVIEEYRCKADVARANGKKGGRPRKGEEKPSGFPSGSYEVPICNLEESGLKTNQEPITNNQEPFKSPCPQQAEDGHKFRFAEIQEAYNRICSPTLPACRAANDARKKQVKRMVDLEFNGKRPFREHGLAMWESYFADCLTNKHWCGDNDRSWRADFDFVTNSKNAIKLLERVLG